MRNNGRASTSKAKYLTIRNISLRDVVKRLHKHEIAELNIERTGAQPGSSAFIGGYSKSLSEFMATLPEERLQEYETMADRWTSEGVDDQTKRE